MFSIYTSLYNLDNEFIDWKSALDNFSAFADEIVISTLPQDYNFLYDFVHSKPIKNNFTIEVCDDISLDDLAFDGKLKNAALKKCTQPFCILLDGDEEIPLYNKLLWEQYANFIENSNADGIMIPSINLCKDKYHYKDIGWKFYLHKNNIGIERGIVNYAKLDNGKINIQLSDTTEPIINGELGKFIKLSNNINDIKNGVIPFVFHHWGDNFEKRLKQNQFWLPVWENRAGKEVKNIILLKESLEKIEIFPHGLKI
jgi:hypothetical protein